MGRQVVETSAPVSLCKILKMPHGFTVFLFSPGRRTLAAWWSPWTPTGPCPSSRQRKWRSIATGTSMSLVRTCESTTHILTKTTYMKILCLARGSGSQSFDSEIWKNRLALQKRVFQGLVRLTSLSRSCCHLPVEDTACCNTSVRIINLGPVANEVG